MQFRPQRRRLLDASILPLTVLLIAGSASQAKASCFPGVNINTIEAHLAAGLSLNEALRTTAQANRHSYQTSTRCFQKTRRFVKDAPQSYPLTYKAFWSDIN